ncbi:MAG: hypothetical protein JO100_10295 [Pseudonocardia sp.]|nr:hypothetical protein [Pseudonocardia sp.]
MKTLLYGVAAVAATAATSVGVAVVGSETFALAASAKPTATSGSSNLTPGLCPGVRVGAVYLSNPTRACRS